jgi:hypothetical protein
VKPRVPGCPRTRGYKPSTVSLNREFIVFEPCSCSLDGSAIVEDTSRARERAPSAARAEKGV